MSSSEQLKSLPYLSWVPAEKNIEKAGVIINKDGLSYKGFYIYNYDNFPTAYLIDNSGKIIHTWAGGMTAWHHVEICSNGDLLGIYQNHCITKLDWDSNILWRKYGKFHHDIAVAENRDIYTITSENEIFFISGMPLFIRNDYIIILSPDGNMKRKISLFKILGREFSFNITKLRSWLIYLKTMLPITGQKLICIGAKNYPDTFHTNTVEIINKDIAGVCKKGDILICARNLGLIAILDAKKEKLLWKWGPGTLDQPHHPILLENGNILVFDNGANRGYSRVLELDPVSKNIVWEYKANPAEQFFSKTRGGNQRLPNGNTLITESDNGRVFEVTYDREIVWEFYGPCIDKKSKKRRPIYRMMRIIDAEKYPFLFTGNKN